jgi:hypothetical protein
MNKVILILILIGAVVGITYSLKPRQAHSPTNGVAPQEMTAVEPTVSPSYVKYRGQDGRSALALLQELAAVEYTQYDFGIFVDSINSVRPDDRHFWKLYLNGAEAQVGAGELMTANGDVLEWKLEEIRTSE